MASRFLFAAGPISVRTLVLASGLLSLGLPAFADHAREEWVGINDGGNFAKFDHTYDGSEAVCAGAGAITGGAHASANYGVLHAYAHGISTGTSGYSWASANAKFSDQITITGGTGSGFVTFDIKAEGTFITDGPFPTAGIYSTDNPSGTVLKSGTTTAHGTTPIAFTYGVPFDYYAQLEVLITWGSAGAVGEGVADFGNTAWLSAVNVADANGNPVDPSSLSVIGESGTDYKSVPAPGAAWVLSGGLLGASLRRRR